MSAQGERPRRRPPRPQRRRGVRPSARAALLAYLFVTHAALAATGVWLLRDRPLWLFGFELLFLLLLMVGLRLVRGLFVPLELIRTGAELLEEGEFTTHFREIGQREVDDLAAVYNRMADRLREERLRVREQNELLDRLVEASPGGVVVCDFEGRITELNPAAERILSCARKAVVGLGPAEVPALAPLADLASGGSRIVARSSGRRIRATCAEFRDRGFLRRFFLVEELTEELRRTEKEAYGNLVRMIAHEVNNSVGPVASLVESIALFGRELPADERRRFEEGLEVAAHRLDHLRSFVDGFAAVVKLPAPRPEACDLAAVLRDVVTLIEPILEQRRIRCQWRDEPRNGERSLGVCRVDKNQLEQVLLNVLKNAYEAIGEEGVITLRLLPASAESSTAESSTAESSKAALLQIEDSGPGLSAEAREHLLSPFFSSKANGRGIGLTLVREILTRHGIDFSLRNAEGGGALFEMRLSAARPPRGAVATAQGSG